MTEDLDIPDEIVVTPYDGAEFLKDEDDDVAFLNAALELNAPDMIGGALRMIVRARGMRRAAAESADDLQRLAHALGDGAAVELGIALRVLSALGIKLVASRPPISL